MYLHNYLVVEFEHNIIVIVLCVDVADVPEFELDLYQEFTKFLFS